MNKINFSKYEGLGNDFIIIDCRINEYPYKFIRKEKNIAAKLCDRNFGIGADGIIFILDSSIDLDIRMVIINSDGNEAEMCGNGVRCLAKYLLDREFKSNTINIETKAGLVIATYEEGDEIKVNMGEPEFTSSKIPTTIDIFSNEVPCESIMINGNDLKIYASSMGNPHAVIFVNNLDEIPISDWGPLIEKHHFFPSRTNVHFVKINNRNSIDVLVWERGCGVTLACGTGACACVAISFKLGLTENIVDVNLKGGLLNIDWNQNNKQIYMKGPANIVYEGVLNNRIFI
tara:strand:- start:21078 stop:21941 length:864 start_codon:yes stop_codon:yes gene_type:complete